MSSQPIGPGRDHPVAAFAARLDRRLEELSGTPFFSMSAAEKRDTLRTLARARAKYDALQLRLLTEADTSDATVEKGDGSAAEWLAGETRQTRRDARADLKLAKAIDRYEVLGAGMDAGCVNPAQARVIVAALDRLPSSGEFAVSRERRLEAEHYLVEQAARFDADKLKVLGLRLFEVIAPDLAEKYEGRVLEAQEARALRKTTFSMSEDGAGICHGRFRMPSLHGHMLRKFLLSYTNPARSQDAAESGIDPDLPTEVRNGIAFTQLLEAIPANWVPQSGGCGATIVVTMRLEQLLADLDQAGVCTLDTAGRISASEARRLACQAGIIPIVLGGRSQPLDIGRKCRFHKEHQRVAMAVRDGGCTAVDCDKPASMAVAHHETPWSQGGPTSVDRGRLVCPHHHRRMHDPAYAVTRHPDGKISFHRRT